MKSTETREILAVMDEALGKPVKKGYPVWEALHPQADSHFLKGNHG